MQVNIYSDLDTKESTWPIVFMMDHVHDENQIEIIAVINGEFGQIIFNPQ